MKLVISEKQIAARRIAYILGQGNVKSTHHGKIPVYEFTRAGEPWAVIGLKGHIISLDYPAGFNQWTKIDPADLITVEPCKAVTEKQIASALKTLVKEAPEVIVATDFDREGELIGMEVVKLLLEYNPNIKVVKRARFSAITPYEINTAFDNLTEVDGNLSNAGEARQAIDLVWGAVLTRFMSLTSRRLGKDFLSIGRVQSPTLAILVEREKEIKEFVPKPYWQLQAKLHDEKNFDALHEIEVFWDKPQVDQIYDKIKDTTTATVTCVDTKEHKELPPAPFNTTSFLQAASYLGFSAAKSMSLAEELYLLGLTSYPRTDNTVYPPSLNLSAILDKLKNGAFAKEVAIIRANGRDYPTRGKLQTTDHPPIHPVDVPTDKKLAHDQAQIYELIVRRFLATLAKDTLSETTHAKIDIGGEPFTASGYRLIEANWKEIYHYIKEKRKDLPKLTQGEQLTITKLTVKEDATKPPQRYSQGSLIAKMEQLQLGTKSTRHDIISKLYDRKYVMGIPPVPTSTAFAVVGALTGCHVTNPKMTAQLEIDMNEIAEGRKTLQDTIQESRQMLTTVMKDLEPEKENIKTTIRSAVKEQNTVGPCPDCGKDLIVRISRNRKRFVGCTGYPNCTRTYSLPQNGGLIIPKTQCDACHHPMVRIISKGKRPWDLCLNPDCPKKPKKTTPPPTPTPPTTPSQTQTPVTKE